MKTAKNSPSLPNYPAALENEPPERVPGLEDLDEQLSYLRLPVMRQRAVELSRQAVQKGWDPLRYLCALVQLETENRRDKSAQKRITQAKFPVVKTMDNFDWTWPSAINRDLIEALFDLRFIERKANVLLFGNPGLGKPTSRAPWATPRL